MARTVIIPAHNEELVLRENLDSLLSGLADEVSVIVVCNGCTDDTISIARSFGPRVTVLVADEASKTNALNRADDISDAGPRAYIDADVVITGADVGRLLDAVDDGGMCLAEPTAVFETSASSWAVRAYYVVWLSLHGGEPGDVGGGVYCLSAGGRARFQAFPTVISDDAYVRWQFSPSEVRRLDTATSRVLTPTDIGSLVRIKTRSAMGTAQLKQHFPELKEKRQTSSRTLSRKVSTLPLRTWPLVPLYVVVQLAVKVRAARFSRKDEFTWERDQSSRDGR